MSTKNEIALRTISSRRVGKGGHGILDVSLSDVPPLPTRSELACYDSVGKGGSSDVRPLPRLGRLGPPYFSYFSGT
jgi:hypothetical protein